MKHELLKPTNDYVFKRIFGYIGNEEIYILSNKTIIILICQYRVKGLESINQILTKWQIKDAKCGKKVLTDLLEFYILELPKFNEKSVENIDLKNWVKFLEKPEMIKMSDIKENEALKKAKSELEYISGDEREQELAEARLMEIMDKKAIEAAGYDKGIEQGEKQEKIKIAKEALKMNFSIEQIMKLTGLSKEEIEDLNK